MSLKKILEILILKMITFTVHSVMSPLCLAVKQHEKTTIYHMKCS